MTLGTLAQKPGNGICCPFFREPDALHDGLESSVPICMEKASPSSWKVGYTEALLLRMPYTRNWFHGECQSRLRIRASGSTVLTGKIANGQQIPLPSGFSASQCTWSVSNAENPHGWKPNYFAGSVATYDANRIVKCGFYDEYNFYGGTHRTDLSGKCSYIVVCQ